MKAITTHTGIVAPLDRENIDTDAIMPKQYLKSIHRTGFGPYIFDEWRYKDTGYFGMDCSKREINPDFVLNQPAYKRASILLTRENFGCGSSREHAPWGLSDFGFVVIIAPSFADIFYNNCTKNGLLPVRLTESQVEHLFSLSHKGPQILTVDLEAQTVLLPSGDTYHFEIAPDDKNRLLNGLDDIALTLEETDKIRAFEHTWSQRSPWIFDKREG